MVTTYLKRVFADAPMLYGGNLHEEGI